jgi:hypothetical protein
MGTSNGELEDVFSVLFYLVGYTVMMFGVFFFSGLRYYQYPSHYQIRYIGDIKSLSK